MTKKHDGKEITVTHDSAEAVEIALLKLRRKTSDLKSKTFFESKKRRERVKRRKAERHSSKEGGAR